MSAEWKTLFVSGASPDCDEGGAMDARDFLHRAEQRTDRSLLGEPTPITLVLEQGEDFCDTVRKIYLRGIYGRFSLLLRGILFTEDWQQALRLCHRSFCELSEEGREFNGYIPRGILVDSPLVLCGEDTPEGVDFFCLDYHRLCRLWGGGRDSEPIRRSAEAQMAAFFRRHPRPERTVLLRNAPDADVCRFLLRQQIGELLLPENEVLRTRELLQICRKED